MGTSASSNGPRSGVPFDPPWLDDIASPQLDGTGQPNDQERDGVDDGTNGIDDPTDSPQQSLRSPELAPPRRFQSARRALRTFVSTGSRNAFRKALGHYSRTGMGGARKAAGRMRLSTTVAGNLFGVLQSASKGADPAIREWVASLTGNGAIAQDIVDEIIRTVGPDGGSQDETSCRDSMAHAMEDLLQDKPDIDLLHLVDDDIWMLMGSFLAHEAFNRLCLDIGQVFEDPALSARERVMRMNEMRDYLKAELYTQMAKVRRGTQSTASNQLRVLLQTALQNTFLVYEGSL